MNKPKTLAEQKANKCKHFNGTMNKVCRAGVDYASVETPGPQGQRRGLPCFKDNNDGCHCDKREFYTEAEIAAQVEEIEGRFNRTMHARAVIVKHLGGPWKKGMAGSQGEIPCPVCRAGTLRFSRAGYNGHIHAQCGTKGCVSWME